MALAWAEAGLCAALGSIALGKHGFFFDESVSAAISSGSFRSIIRASRTAEPNMFGYHVLLHAWQTGFGTSEVALRSLSVVAMAITVVFVFAIGRRVLDARTGLIAGLLFAVAPFTVHVAQDARSYAMLTLLVTAATYLLLVAVEHPTRPTWLAYAAVASLAVYMHFFGGLVIAAHVVSIVAMGRRAPWRKVGFAGAIVAVLMAPVVALLALSRGGAQWSWMAASPPVTLHGVLSAAESVAGGRKLAAVIGVAAIGGLWWICIAWRANQHSTFGWRLTVIVSWLVVPFASALVFSVVVRSFFLDRYFVICLPPLVLVAAMGLSRLRWRPALAAAGAVILALSLAGVRNEYRFVPGWTGGWRAAASLVMRDSERGDGLAFCPAFERNPFDYYGRRYVARGSLRAVAGNAAYDPAQEVFYRSESPVVALRDLSRLWVVGATPDAGWPLEQQETLCGLSPQQAGFDRVLEHVEGPVRVQLFVCRG